MQSNNTSESAEILTDVRESLDLWLIWLSTKKVWGVRPKWQTDRTYGAMPDCSLGKATDTKQLLRSYSQHHYSQV